MEKQERKTEQRREPSVTSRTLMWNHRVFVLNSRKGKHTFKVVPGNILQRLIQEDHWERNLQNHDPLGPAQGRHLEDQLEARERLLEWC